MKQATNIKDRMNVMDFGVKCGRNIVCRGGFANFRNSYGRGKV